MNTLTAIFYRSYFVAHESFHLVSVLHCCPLPVVVVFIVQLLIVCSNPHSFECRILGSLYYWQTNILPIKLGRNFFAKVRRGVVLVISWCTSSDIITQRLELNSSKYSRSAWVGVVQDERTHGCAVVGCLHHEFVLVSVCAETFHALHGQTTISGNYHSWVTSGLGSSILLELLVWSIVLQLVCRDKLTSWQVQVTYSHLLIPLDVGLVVGKDDVLTFGRNFICCPVGYVVEVVVYVTCPIVVAAGIHISIVSRTFTLTAIGSYRYTILVYVTLDDTAFNHIFSDVAITFYSIRTSVFVAIKIKVVGYTVHIVIAWQHQRYHCVHLSVHVCSLCKGKILLSWIGIQVRQGYLSFKIHIYVVHQHFLCALIFEYRIAVVVHLGIQLGLRQGMLIGQDIDAKLAVLVE